MDYTKIQRAVPFLSAINRANRANRGAILQPRFQSWIKSCGVETTEKYSNEISNALFGSEQYLLDYYLYNELKVK
jgi:hypothetical protein